MTAAAKSTRRSQAEGGIAAPTPTKTIRTMVTFLSLFLVLLIIRHDVFVTVDAFATRSTARTPVSYTSVRTILWSSSKTPTLEEETATDNIVESPESGSSESSPEKTALAANANGDGSGDAGIESVTNEKDKDDKSEEEENLMQQIKDSGVAGVISYAAWELAFWTVSVPVCVLGYKEVTG